MPPSPNSAVKINDVPAPRGCSRGHVGSHPGSALQLLATGKESAGDKGNPCPGAALGQAEAAGAPGACPTSQLLAEDAVLRVDTKPRELEQAVYGDLPGAKPFNLSL